MAKVTMSHAKSLWEGKKITPAAVLARLSGEIVPGLTVMVDYDNDEEVEDEEDGEGED